MDDFEQKSTEKLVFGGKFNEKKRFLSENGLKSGISVFFEEKGTKTGDFRLFLREKFEKMRNFQRILMENG